MKAAEILRKLADLVDQHSDEQDRPTNSVPHAELEPVEVDNTDYSETSTMVPPLQQKIELLKKITDVDSHYDEFDDEGNPLDQEESADELDIIKQNAGINPVVVQLADDDNDILG